MAFTQSLSTGNAALTTNLTPFVAGATAAATLAGLALCIPLSDDPSSTKGYTPVPLAGDPNFFTSFFLSTPSPLLFHYEGENTGTFESDITDHYVEDNTTVVDQIGLRPEVITVSGFIGELNDILPLPLQILQTMANTLLLVDSYTPELSVTALTKLNQATLLYESAASIANSAISAWGSLIGSGEQVGQATGTFTVGASASQNQQQQMFQQFYGYWTQRTLFNIQTPWAIFTNMAIKTLRAIQDAETRMITNFEVTFKKIRTASTQITSLSAIASARAATQSAAESSNGATSGIPGTSLGSSIGATQ